MTQSRVLTTLDAVKAAAAQLSEKERNSLTHPEKINKNQVFNLISEGNAVGLYVALTSGQISPHDQNSQGLTPLHMAVGYNAETMTEILLESPNKAPWMRDHMRRLPLDIAQHAGNKRLTERLEKITYSQRFEKEIESDLRKSGSPQTRDGDGKGKQGGLVALHKQLKGFSQQRKSMGNPDTRPSYAKSFEPKAPFRTKRSPQEKDLDR